MTVTKFISLAEAAAEHDADIVEEIVAGSRKAIGREDGVPIPAEHFAIPREPPPRDPTMVTWVDPDYDERTGPVLEHVLEYRSGAADPGPVWLDVANGTIRTAATFFWTEIQVEGTAVKLIPLPKLKVANSDASKAAAWALTRLYEPNGYPKHFSMQQLADRVTAELRKSATTLDFRVTVSRDTIERLLGRRGS